MSEQRILNEILLAIGSRPDIRVWRNNSGALVDSTGRLVKFGLPGSADILGVMKPMGRFLAIEVKSEHGKQSEQQKRFENMITSWGGIYILARSVTDAVEAISAVTSNT